MKRSECVQSPVVINARGDDPLYQQYCELLSWEQYEWLRDGSAWWTVQEVAVGVGVGISTIVRLCQQGKFSGALNHGHRMGWRIPFNALIPWLYAGHMEHQ
jgi:hypothetical protein